jgi:ribosome biogenesis protein Nip4
MKAKVITGFAQRFGVKIELNPDLTVEKNGRYYLINPALKPLVKSGFFYAGLYLGKAKEGKFFPSFNLLSMLAKKDAARIVLDRKAAWLFICGRDVFSRGVVKTLGSAQRGSDVLVLNEFGECLGFGRIVGGFEDSKDRVAVRNVVDVGDFLRREK